MAAVIISRPSGITDKVLNKSEYSKEMVGLETLVETYTVLTSARISIQPSRNTLHSSFSSSPNKFSRMSVETVSFRELPGDITEMTVVYVGLTTPAGLPPAIVSMIPTTGAGVFGPDVVVQVNYLSNLTETQIVSGKISDGEIVSRGAYSPAFCMPRFINGTELPANPHEPFVDAQAYYTRVYDGYVLNNIQTSRRGLFLNVTSNYQEKYYANYVMAGSKWSSQPVNKAAK